MEGYTQIWDYMTNEINPNLIQRNSDGAFIPNDPANMDWQAYQAWLDEGNWPSPPRNMPRTNIIPPICSIYSNKNGTFTLCTGGQWSGNPTVYGYLWMLNDGFPVPGASGSTWNTIGHEGSTVWCDVTVYDQYGTAYPTVSTSNSVLIPGIPGAT